MVAVEVLKFALRVGLCLVLGMGFVVFPWRAGAGEILVSRPEENQVWRYNGVTGELLGPVVEATPTNNLLQGPYGLGFGPDGDLYVVSQLSDSILRYDGVTGQFREVVVNPLVIGLQDLFRELRSLVFGPDGGLYFNDRESVFVGRAVGVQEIILPFCLATLRQPESLTFGPNGDLYVSSFSRFSSANDRVLRYDTLTGELIDTLVPLLFRQPTALAFGPDGHLYISSGDAEIGRGPHVSRYDVETGQPLDIFILGGSGGLIEPRGLVFGADNHLYVSSFGTDSILRYDGQSGNFIDAFVPSRRGGLIDPVGLVFGPDGHLYVSSSSNHSILRYDGQSGVFLGAFVPSRSGGLENPRGLVFGPDGHLYVSSRGTDSVLRYDGQTGAFLGAFVPSGRGGLVEPGGLVFDANGFLYVTSSGTDNVLFYEPNGQYLGAFVQDQSTLSLSDLAFGGDGRLFVSGFGDFSSPCNLREAPSFGTGSQIFPATGPGLTAGPDNQFYVSGSDTNTVRRGVVQDIITEPGRTSTREFVESQTPDFVIPERNGGLRNPGDLIFGPTGDLYVASFTIDGVWRYDGQSGEPIFKDPFDLRGRVVLFTPNANGGYDLVVTAAPAGRVVETNFGNGLAQSDDDADVVAFTEDFTFPFFGQIYTSVYVSSNGHLTFDRADIAPTTSLASFVQQPQVALLFTDFAPGNDLAGISDVFVRQLSDRFVVTYSMVPEFPTSGANTLQVVLFRDGRIQFSYNADMTALTGLVGLSPGFSADLDETDISAAAPANPTGPIFEHFTGGAFFVEPGSGGLQEPRSLAFGPDGDLYVSSFGTNSVLRYDGQTGEFVEVFVANNDPDRPQGTALGTDGALYVSDAGSNSVLRFNSQTREFIDIFVAPSSGGLASPQGLVLGPDGHLYVSSAGSDSVLRYDGQTGQFLGDFVAPGSGGLTTPQGLVFGPDGQLYVSSAGTDSVLRYDGTTAAFLSAFVASGSGGLETPRSLVFGPDGHLYVSSAGSDSVLRYNGQTGAFVNAFIPAGRGGLAAPHGLLFDLDGHLYVSSMGTAQVLRYDSQTGQFLDVFIPAPAGGSGAPTFLLMLPTRPDEFAAFTAGNCAPNGLVTDDVELTPADVLLTLQHYLGMASLNPCQQIHANVVDATTSPITPADARCIFQRFLGFSSCTGR